MMRPNFRRWIKRQLRGLGSLLAASFIVLTVLAFAMISLAAPEAQVPVESGYSVSKTVEAAVQSAVDVPSLYIKALADKPIALRAEIDVQGWSNRGQRIIDTRISSIESPVSTERTRDLPVVYPTGQITEQLSGKRVLASVSASAAEQLPETGRAHVALVVTPKGETATLVIDEVLSAEKEQGGARVAAAAVVAADSETSMLTVASSVSAAASTPRVVALSRYWGPPGTTVTMTGTGFGRSAGTSWVTCGGAKAKITSWSDTKIVFRIPALMTRQGYIGAVIKKRSTNGLYFSPFQSPTITSITPREGAPGTVVTLRGTGFGARQADGWVTFSGSTGQVTSWSDSAIRVVVPRDATSGYAGVVAHGMTSNGVLYGPLGSPLVQSVSSHVMLPERSVTLRGRSFGVRPGTVVVGGQRVIPASWSPTEVKFTVPMGLASGYVGVVRSDTWTSNGVWMSSAPRLDAISHWWSTPSGELTLKGVGFGATQQDRRVFLARVEMPVKSWSDTSITVEVPPAAGSGYVGVGTLGACSNGIYCLVETPARIEAVSPKSVALGEPLVISGSGFGADRRNSKVLLGGSSECSVLSWTDTKIIVAASPIFQTTYVGVVKNGVSSNGVWVTPRLAE